MSSIYLASDFEDYYDHHFDLKEYGDVEFRRFSSEGPRRREMFRLLKRMEIRTPIFGKVKYMYDKVDEFYGRYDMKVDENDKLVVYLDEVNHNENNKLLLPINEAIEKYPDKFSSHYVPHKESPDSNILSVSHRHLQIGTKLIWLRYTSDDSWRSNAGNVNVEVIKIMDRPPEFEQPIYAIDYVCAPGFVFYAVDYNIAPVLKGTGIEKYLSSSEIVKLLKEQIKVPING